MGQSDDWAVYSFAQGGRAVPQKDAMNLSVLKHVSHGMSQGTALVDCQQLIEVVWCWLRVVECK